jgi:peroxiredoxin
MRQCKNYQTTRMTEDECSRHPYHWVNAVHSQAAKSQNVVLFFMCRSTCSHCWKQALALAKLNDHLAALDTTVLLVGDGRYREQAQRLVEELELPFRYISDNGALRRYYHVGAGEGRACKSAVVFVDRQGIIRFGRFGMAGRFSPSHGLRDFKQFLRAIRMVHKDRHIMNKLPTGKCQGSFKPLPLW